jgi:hypothetical protein
MRSVESVYRNNRKLKRGKDYHICHTKLISPVVRLHFLPRENTFIKINWIFDNV